MKNKVIAIDGPAGAGKSTVAQLVAAGLEYIYIDTGAMYRAVAWKALRENDTVFLTDDFIIKTVKNMDVRLQYADKTTKVYVDGEDVSDHLRTPEVSKVVSQVAKLAPVREKMVFLQRKMAENGAVVMDGRDIGSNVLPNADVKIFLTASVEERAKRRFEQMMKKGYEVDLLKLKEDIENRDKADMERTISPLIKTSDAILLDTTSMSVRQVTDVILSLASK
ncbi:(d)CMP kinase [Pectinatus haikarae]|uniref:Cytidylate kinase n=1 Tax=Pectinatus haikarae TaxID=349096 RepID=A0ABT9Y8C2_9FIRM|nr:(d)CMP kinase [Pectinatus haikarae]MDQ0203745.1 cytidylate kinase [Pectinatus haikarae]